MRRLLSSMTLMAAAMLAACGDSDDTGGGGGTTTTSASGGGSTATTTTSATTSSGGDVCGDGEVGTSEACDDGSTSPGDGCDDACAVETGFACSGAPSACAPICGDGILLDGELCDDGDTDAGDGCDDGCAPEAGFDCSGEPSACASICGDGMIVGGELCDDGNADAADGCDDACAIESGYACDGAPSTCATVCGDALVVGSELCDDGNVDASDGCDDVCSLEVGWSCDAAEPSVCTTICGDSMILGAEVCDDGNVSAADGCDDLCAVETGWACDGAEPSSCDGICGDGAILGSEICDDMNLADADGCSMACIEEAGFACSGAPSACLATCGDDLIVGTETCDDGGVALGDGCDGMCATEAGWTCMGLPSACSTVCGDGMILGAEACDDMDAMDNDGCSAVCAIELGYQCTGAPSTCTVVCGDDVIGPGETCDDGGATGGDGCSAACQTESGWACVGAPSTCATVCGDGVLIGAEQCDDGNVASNDCCSATCQLEGCEVEINDTFAQANDFNALGVNGKMYGNINPAGDDDYYAITLASAGQIVATTTAGFTDICDMAGGSGAIESEIQLYGTDGVTSLATNDDALGTYCSSVTALVAAGTYYVRTASSATFAPNGLYNYGITIATTLAGPGESWLTAEPIAGSGPIAPTSAQRLTAPSCFPASGNVHWYAYVSQNGQVTVSGDAAGYVALFNAAGVQTSCGTDALTTPISALPGAGGTVYIAVESPSLITALTIVDAVYGGVGTTLTNMNITGLSTTDYELAVSGTQLFMTSSATAYVAPKAGNAAAVLSGAMITSSHIGYDGVFVNNSLFTIDTTTSTSASRLFKVYDEPTNTWAPTAWDLTPTYVASSAAQTITYDGTDLIYATYQSSTSTGTASFYSVSPLAPATPALLGTNTNIFAVTGIAADASYIYAYGRAQANDVYGLYRIDRANITGPVTALYTTTGGSSLHASVVVDDTTAASYVYFRATSGVPSDVHVVQNASSATPSYVGVISTEGTTSDYAMTYDPSDNSIYLFSTETVSAGAIFKLQ